MDLFEDKALGCLVGGAAGDALGYTVEFLSLRDIQRRFGPEGIRDYVVDARSGNALVSDDTQMTLFTAAGLLMGLTRGAMRGIMGRMSDYVSYAYLDWLHTQTRTYEDVNMRRGAPGIKVFSWTARVPGLYHRRAPGNTCLSALNAIEAGEDVRNDSKGCGGVMRVAPVALLGRKFTDIASAEGRDYAVKTGGEAAKLTHRHPLGWLPAALLTDLLLRILDCEGAVTRPMFGRFVEEGIDTMRRLYPETGRDIDALASLCTRALRLASEDMPDAGAIHLIGEGWVGDEALAIAIYCTARHIGDFEAALVASVNHGGDSDSTGSITGNLIGAVLGYRAIPEKYMRDLELRDVTEAVARDLAAGPCISEYCDMSTPEQRQWYARYCYHEPAGIDIDVRRRIRVVTGDITDLDVDAVVNAANSSLLGGGGVDGAIHRAAGPGLLEECRKLGGCPAGESRLTGAYRLPSEYVIHTVGPRWRGGNSGEAALLASCYDTAVDLAVEAHLHSVAFPCVSTGIYHYPRQEAARIAVDTVVRRMLADFHGTVTFCCYRSEDAAIYEELLRSSR